MSPAPIESAPASLVEIARAYARGKVLCAAVRLGIADALGDSEKSLAELAAATRADADSLRRLLRALAVLGAVQEVAPDRFALTALGQPLRRDAPRSVWASIIFWADLIADAWTYLPDCVRAGGMSGAAEALARTGAKSRWSLEPDATQIFHAVFAEPSADELAPLASAYDFSPFRVVADLGGAGGALLAAILRAHPHARGVLVDRPDAVARATQRLASVGLSDRCELIARDLQESVPAGPDVYILKRVLHGYDDDGARHILANCRAVMSPQSRMLVIEAVVPERIVPGDPHAESILMSDLNMLTVTGGRERSAPDWTALLASASFQLQRIIPVPDDTASIIEAAPRGA